MERMGENGRSLLRLLQNESIPLIDLFVREAFQNSLDATLKNVRETKIDVGAVDFDVNSIAHHFEGIGETLIERYRNENPKAIYVSDKNTSGLTGAVRDNENSKLEDSKIYKLIYGISMNQDKSGAGGSWGLGKTSFFRIGNGIVIYYTRVLKENGKYEERLAASLIEDASKPDALLTENSRGIAWWGARADEDGNDDYSDTFPITDTFEIENILKVFGIDRYKESETGTTVIIPFVNEKKLFAHDSLNNEEDSAISTKNWWEKDIRSRLEIAVQKWYGPRILNVEYQKLYGSYLFPEINGELLSPDKFQPFFKKVRELYIQALKGEADDDISVEPIQLERMALSKESDKIVGYFAFARLTEKDLEMTAPDNNPHPLSYLGYTEAEDLMKTNTKIIAYARKPGMIIDYDVNGIWSQNVSNLENEFILGFFVPRSKAKLHEDFQNELLILDDYLRKTENADHATWEDVLVNDKKITIVRRIRNKVIEKLKNEYEEGIEEKRNSKASLLGRKLGNQLLPPTNFGKRGVKRPSIGGDGNGNGVKKKFHLNIQEFQMISDDSVKVNLSVQMASNTEGVISVNVNLGSSHYDVQKWTSEMGEKSDYPFKIQGLNIISLNDKPVNEDFENIDYEGLNILLSTFNRSSSLDLSNFTGESLKIECQMNIKVKDPLIQPYIQGKEVR